MGAVVAVIVAAIIATMGTGSQAGEVVLVRGIVKPGGDSNSINVYYTHIATASDPTKLRGLRKDVDLANANKYEWVESGGSLVKKRVSSNPTPGKEVVAYGTLRNDLRINASWVVENYREYTMEGTLEGNSLDTGKTDSGWLTVNVDSLIFRDITPSKKFKESQFKDLDVLVRYNGLTRFTALGKAKQADDVTAAQQNVKIEGEMQDESTFVASKVNEQ